MPVPTLALGPELALVVEELLLEVVVCIIGGALVAQWYGRSEGWGAGGSVGGRVRAVHGQQGRRGGGRGRAGGAGGRRLASGRGAEQSRHVAAGQGRGGRVAVTYAAVRAGVTAHSAVTPSTSLGAAPPLV